MQTDLEFTLTMVKCPSCDTVQPAIIEHTVPFYTYLHFCEKCDYVIMESEFDQINPFVLTPEQAKDY
jgi:phage FluMu protein Com